MVAVLRIKKKKREANSGRSKVMPTKPVVALGSSRFAKTDSHQKKETKRKKIKVRVSLGFDLG